MTRYDRAAMAPTLNAIAHIAPDGEVVITLKDALLEEHNEEAVAMMLGTVKQFGWAVEKPRLTAVADPPRPGPKHRNQRRQRRIRLLSLGVVVFFFASAFAVVVGYGVQQDRLADLAAGPGAVQTFTHAARRRRETSCASASCRTLNPSRTPDGSGAPALSSPALRRPIGRVCATGIRRWGRRIRRCYRSGPSPSPTPWPGGSSPPEPWPQPSYRPPSDVRGTSPPPTPCARQWPGCPSPA